MHAMMRYDVHSIVDAQAEKHANKNQCHHTDGFPQHGTHSGSNQQTENDRKQYQKRQPYTSEIQCQQNEHNRYSGKARSSDVRSECLGGRHVTHRPSDYTYSHSRTQTSQFISL